MVSFCGLEGLGFRVRVVSGLIINRDNWCDYMAQRGLVKPPDAPSGDWSEFPIVRGPIFGFPLQYGALHKVPPFWEQ